MSAVSPFKKNLLQFQLTPAKAIVATDINSWNETSQKVPLRKMNKQRCGSRSTHYAAQNKLEPQQMSNLASLREKRLKLLESSTKKKSLSQQALSSSTKNSPKSTQIGNPERNKSQFLEKSSQFKFKVTQIKVSEFKEEDSCTLKQVDIKFRPRLIPLPSLGHKNQQQVKHTIHRLRTLQNNLIHSKKSSGSHGQESINPKTTNQQLKNIIFKARKIVPIRQKGQLFDSTQSNL